MDLPEIFVKRVLTEKEAKAKVGEKVLDREANITKACIIRDADTKEALLVYMPLERQMAAELRRSLLKVESWGTTGRAGGWDGESKTFGYRPRKPFRGRESCGVTQLAQEQPNEHGTLLKLADEFTRVMASILPEQFTHDKDVLNEKVKDEWRMSEKSLWTSGVINKSASLPYHYDGSNFDTWSAMPVLRREMRGGYLHLPEYDATVACRDSWVLFFPGWKVLHGVTPLLPLTEEAYRFSCVYYALRGMKDCYTYAVETAQGRKKRSSREEELVKAMKGEIDWKVGKKRDEA